MIIHCHNIGGHACHNKSTGRINSVVNMGGHSCFNENGKSLHMLLCMSAWKRNQELGKSGSLTLTKDIHVVHIVYIKKNKK